MQKQQLLFFTKNIVNCRKLPSSHWLNAVCSTSLDVNLRRKKTNENELNFVSKRRFFLRFFARYRYLRFRHFHAISVFCGPNIQQPKDQEESEVAIMDSITSDKEVTGQLGAVDGLDSVQTTTNEDSKEGFQDFHPIVAQSMQLAKSIQELNPAFMSPEALEDVKKQCSTNAIDILKHLLSL